MAEYVPLEFPELEGTGAGDAVTMEDIATWLTEVSQSIVDSGNSYLDSLAELKSIDFSQMGDLPVFNSVVWLGTNPSNIERPVRPTISVGSIDALLARLNTLVAPTAPSNTFNYSDPGYTSTLRGPMIEKLLNDLLNGGYGIDTNDEVALFNRERDREVLATQLSIEEARRQGINTGFTMPQGSMYLAFQRARQEQLSKLSSVNRDIGLNRSTLFVQQRERVINQVLSSENQSIELYNAIQNRAVTIAQTQVQLAIALFDSGIKLFQLQQSAITTQIEATLEAARTQIAIYASDVQAYAAFVNALVAGAQIDIANSSNILRRDITAHQSRVDLVRFQLQQLTTTVEMRRVINQFAVDFFKTGLGAAMSNINGLAVTTQEG